MNKKFMNILFICIFFVTSNGTAQEAVSSNGKFATMNSLKLYYEESGELLTIKVFAIAGATERTSAALILIVSSLG